MENEFKKLQDKIEKLQIHDSSIFIGQSYFFNDGTQLYLIFHSFYYTSKRLSYTGKRGSWKPKDLSDEKLTTSTTTDNSLSPLMKWYRGSNF